MHRGGTQERIPSVRPVSIPASNNQRDVIDCFIPDGARVQKYDRLALRRAFEFIRGLAGRHGNTALAIETTLIIREPVRRGAGNQRVRRHFVKLRLDDESEPDYVCGD